uniref:CPN60II n=1 Tax=Arundo donax TaxID=35708 RepID=A0A0A9E5D2_ARUDO
MLQRTSSSA